MTPLWNPPHALENVPTHYCPGCTHGILHRIIAEVLDEMYIEGETIAVVPVGCAVMAYDYFTCDVQQASHGRAPAVATGIKRVLPDRFVFTYQGDGDLAAIGTAETVHAAARGENITVIFVNNAIYGMTGGQMAPTSLVGQVTQTTPNGRNALIQGYPVPVCEMLSALPGSTYISRTSLHDISHIRETKKAIKKGFTVQKNKQGFSLIEVLSTCPTNWKMSPQESLNWVRDHMTKQYPLGVFKDNTIKEGNQHAT